MMFTLARSKTGEVKFKKSLRQTLLKFLFYFTPQRINKLTKEQWKNQPQKSQQTLLQFTLLVQNESRQNC